jgi:hypothetical protein
MDDESITTVATDGRRLACMAGKGVSIGGFKNSGMSTIVPTKTLQLMLLLVELCGGKQLMLGKHASHQTICSFIRVKKMNS